MYFIPTSKVDEIYCDYPKENSKTCRDLGAFQSYTERLKQNKAMGEYRKTYQQKFMQVRKNNELSNDFEIWKKQAKEKIEASKKELDTTKASKQGVTNQLRNAKNEKNAQVEQLSEEEKETQAELDKFEAEQATIRKEIEEAAKKYQNSSKPTGGTSTKPGNPSASGFIRPIPGYSITCGWYGYAGHTGADYSGSNMYGKAVLAAKSGVVLTSTTKTGGIPNYGSDGNYVGSYSSYGEYIIIDHQDGTMTLYAHGKPGSR